MNKIHGGLLIVSVNKWDSWEFMKVKPGVQKGGNVGVNYLTRCNNCKKNLEMEREIVRLPWVELEFCPNSSPERIENSNNS